MTLARMWRRQLFAASSAALIVPCAMFAALVALALGGGFSQLGVLGQVFEGPPAPGAGPLALARAVPRGAGGSIPVIPVARPVASRPASAGARVGTRVAPVVPISRTGVGSTGGTIAPGGAATRPISQAPAPAAPRPQPAPVASSPGSSSGSSPGSSPSPKPSPSPRPSPVGTVVTVVTSVTSQVPAPVGPAVTQVVQSAGSAAGNLVQSLP